MSAYIERLIMATSVMVLVLLWVKFFIIGY